MIWNRRRRLITVLFALTSLLFAQLALANYVCPGIGSKVAEVSTMAEAGMPCAESMRIVMDEEQPGLCHAHCHTEQQTADTYHLPMLASQTNLGGHYFPPRILPVLSDGLQQASLLRRPTAPPLAIRNCCFRI